MACCGQRRAMASSNGRIAETGRPPRLTSREALYEYTGGTSMTVRGSVSQRTYRFEQPGARVQIDPRDAASMAGLPDLRRV
jgi:hypothetical protein